jgi:hypothetical protein
MKISEMMKEFREPPTYSEREEIVRNAVRAVMPVIEQVYKDTPVWDEMLFAIHNIDLYGKQDKEQQSVGYVGFFAEMHVTPLFYKIEPKVQQVTILHELAHEYVRLTDRYSLRGHEHPEFIKRYSESLRLFGMPIKNPTAEKLQHTIYSPEGLPYKELIKEEDTFNHTYYCPVCQDVFNTTLENFKQEHAHAFEQ